MDSRSSTLPRWVPPEFSFSLCPRDISVKRGKERTGGWGKEEKEEEEGGGWDFKL